MHMPPRARTALGRSALSHSHTHTPGASPWRLPRQELAPGAGTRNIGFDAARGKLQNLTPPGRSLSRCTGAHTHLVQFHGVCPGAGHACTHTWLPPQAQRLAKGHLQEPVSGECKTEKLHRAVCQAAAEAGEPVGVAVCELLPAAAPCGYSTGTFSINNHILR